MEQHEPVFAGKIDQSNQIKTGKEKCNLGSSYTALEPRFPDSEAHGTRTLVGSVYDVGNSYLDLTQPSFWTHG